MTTLTVINSNSQMENEDNPYDFHYTVAVDENGVQYMSSNVGFTQGQVLEVDLTNEDCEWSPL